MKKTKAFYCFYQIFFIEDLKEEMRKLNSNISWIPDAAGSKNYDNWLENLRDNGITRQRYWGTPLPVWRCKSCNDYAVVGSIKELKKLAGVVPDDLHKPWIDNVKVPCKCGKEKERLPDILDVWIDSGSASWNCLYYPDKEEYFNKLYPADFILEGIDQIRGWFNLLFVASMVAMKKPSFKNVYMHGFINDSSGRKMSKSLGNYILPQEVIDKYGADTFRYYSIGGTCAGEDLNYNFDDLKVKHKNLTVFWNIHNYLIDLAANAKINPTRLKIKTEKLGIEEKYILSRLNSTIKSVSESYEKYEIDKVPSKIEELFLDLSRKYIQFVREKATLGSTEEKKVVLYTIYNVFFEGLKMFTTVAPFICEKMLLNFKEQWAIKEESINLYDWPKCDHELIDLDLEKNMEVASSIIQSLLSLREKIQMGVRWPLKNAVIVTSEKDTCKAVKLLKDIIQKQTNIKQVEVRQKLEGVKSVIKADFSKLGPDFGKKSPKIIAALAKESADGIVEHLNKDGKYVLKIDGEKIIIVKEHLIITRVVPLNYHEATIKNTLVYLYDKLDSDLEAEGYSREIMRRVQSLRKNAGMQKSDKINLIIKCEDDMLNGLQKNEKSIKEKVGASKINITNEKTTKKYAHSSKEKIKGKNFEIFFDIV